LSGRFNMISFEGKKAGQRDGGMERGTEGQRNF
jgi:hypothetical protein